MENQELNDLRDYIEGILWVVKHEAEEKISKSIVAHLLESLIGQLDQICDKTEV